MTTRRAFVAGLGAAGLAASGPELFAASARRRARLAFQVYGVRDRCARDYLGTLKAARALGYEGVETGRFYGLDGTGLRSLCAEAGLTLVALQLYPSALVEPDLAKRSASAMTRGRTASTSRGSRAARRTRTTGSSW